jgi:hypothetical protein
MSEKRRYPRHAGHDEVVRMAWTDARQRVQTMLSFCLDISQAGLQVELPEPLAAGTHVHVRDARHRVVGTACVRDCLSRGRRYRIGLEFCGGLRWTPAQRPAEQVDAAVASRPAG